MPYKFFSNSKKTWAAMFAAIENAQKSVYIEMYMFEADIEGYDFFELLRRKAREGVKIVIIVDSLGSRNVKKERIEELKSTGIEYRVLSRYFNRTHRKILVVDEKVMFLGGVNFSENAKKWDDLAVEIKGGLVRHAMKSFAKSYKECGGADETILKKLDEKVSWRVRSWIIEQFPSRKKHSLRKIYRQKIGEAKESILIITPYLVPSRWLVAALDQAIIRGVRVEILMPLRTDIYFADRVNFFYALRLLDSGVKFFMLDKMNHAKAMIVDGREAIVGSHNLDFLSFDYNDEIAVILKEKGAVDKVKEISSKWKAASLPFTKESYKAERLDYILFPALRIFSLIF